jgi:hypothetical protein
MPAIRRGHHMRDGLGRERRVTGSVRLSPLELPTSRVQLSDWSLSDNAVYLPRRFSAASAKLERFGQGLGLAAVTRYLRACPKCHP